MGGRPPALLPCSRCLVVLLLPGAGINYLALLHRFLVGEAAVCLFITFISECVHSGYAVFCAAIDTGWVFRERLRGVKDSITLVVAEYTVQPGVF